MATVKDTEFVRGAEKLSRRIATIRENLNLPILTNEIGDLLLRRTLDRFDKEVDPDGNPWVPLADSTLRRKKQLGYGNKGKLKRTEKLRKSIRRIRSNLGATFINTGAGIRIGIDDPEVSKYARIQNKGSAIVPARRFLGIGALDIKAVDGLMRRKARQLEDL